MLRRRTILMGSLAFLSACAGGESLEKYAARIEGAATSTPGVARVSRISYTGTEISRSVLVEVESDSGDDAAMVTTLEALVRRVAPVLDEPRQGGARIRFVVVDPANVKHFVTTKALGMGDSTTFKEVRDRYLQ